jgi:hypothetical protein
MRDRQQVPEVPQLLAPVLRSIKLYSPLESLTLSLSPGSTLLSNFPSKGRRSHFVARGWTQKGRTFGPA